MQTRLARRRVRRAIVVTSAELIATGKKARGGLRALGSAMPRRIKFCIAFTATFYSVAADNAART